jgi:DNA polymerase III delta prime subunit
MFTDDEFVKYWSSEMEPKITEYLDSMTDTIRHLDSVGNANTVNRTQAGNYLDLKLRDHGVVKERAGKSVFPVGNLPLFRTEIFTGRNQEIENINKQLSPPEAHKLRTYLIYGRPGVGKTQIALEYARRYREDYDAIFWIQCETNTSLRTSFLGIAVALGLDGAAKNAHFEESLTKVLEWLKWTEKRWLLIYDNVKQEQLLKTCWPVGARGSILLTSRSFYSSFKDEQLNSESVSLFNEEESWELLMAYLGPSWQAKHFAKTNMMVDVEIAAAKTLLNQTRGLPLAIMHAAKLVDNENIARHTGDTSARGFLDLFRATFSTLSERQTGKDEPLYRSLNTIWSIAFKALNPSARAILGVLALLSPDEISLDLFRPTNQARLVRKMEFCRTGTETLVNTIPSKTTLTAPPSNFPDAIDELKDGTFISKVGRHVQIHREVQEAVNCHLLKDLKDSFDAAVNLVYEAFPKQEAGRPFSDQWDSCQRWIQHAIHLANKYQIYKQGRSGEENFLEDLPSTDLFVELFANCAW